MSKPWGGIGAWALEAERAEAEERERAEAETAARSPTLAGGEPAQSFPTLKEAAATKPKKKKAVPFTLSELTTGAYVGPGGGRRQPPSLEPRGLTHDEMLRLPTGPRERSAEELEPSRLGGGFRSYGYGAGGFPGRRSDDGRRPYGGGFEEEQRRGPPSRVSDLDQPSRADEVDNWAASKKTFIPAASTDSGRHDRYSSFGSGSSSRADEFDTWSRGKQSLPSRYPSFGSGFRDSPGPSDSDRWVRGGDGGPLPHNGERERPRLALDPPKGEAGVSAEPVRIRPSPFGAARPREEVLAGKGLDWRKIDSDIEFKKTSRPTSSHSSRPSSAQSSRPGSPGSQAAVAATAGGGAEGAPKVRQKVNPFGDAKPREILLEERGKDWRKIDLELEHRRVHRPETAEEKLLKEEINNLKNELKETEGNLDGSSVQTSAEEMTSLHDQIIRREKDLELLITELDDKVRFGQRAASDVRPGSGAGRTAMISDRPGSGAGRTAMISDRQPSHSGILGDSRSTEFMERPRSHGGTGDMWVRSMDDRRGFQGTRERGFLGSRDMDRPKSRERW